MYKISTYTLTFVVLFTHCITLLADSKLSAKEYTLKECYERALEKSEQTKISKTQIDIANVQYQQALSEIMPKIDLSFEHVSRDNADFGRVTTGTGLGVDDSANVTGGNSGRLGRTQASSRVSISQPIFHGLREFILVDAMNYQTRSSELAYTRFKELLYQDVAELYYQLIFSEKEEKYIQASMSVLADRIKELTDYIKLGKARESEKLAAQTELADIKTVHIALQGLVRATRELLSFLIDVPAPAIKLSPLVTQQKLHNLPIYLEYASKRNDLLASKLMQKSQVELLEYAKRERWPKLSLAGNAYGWEDPDRNREWDLVLELSIPIFDGGKISSKINQQNLNLTVAQLESQKVQRQIIRDVNLAYVNTETAMSQMQSTKKLVNVAEKNYKLQKEDYANGVVTNLEVLQSIRQVQDFKRKLVSAEREYYTNLVALHVAAGNIQDIL